MNRRPQHQLSISPGARLGRFDQSQQRHKYQRILVNLRGGG